MFKKNKILKIGAGILVLTIIILAIGKKQGWVGKKQAEKVITERVKRNSITETVSANGKIQPVTEVKISPDVSGEIIELPVKEGDKINKGDLLARIKPDIYISDVERAEATLDNAVASLANARARLTQSKAQFENSKASFERNDKLWTQQVISASDYDAAKSSYEVAKADVEAAEQTVKSSEYSVKSEEASLNEAKKNLIKTSIFAPIDGTISKLSVEKGERMVGTSQFTGTEMMRVSNLDEMEVDADVNENDIIRVHKGDTALIEIDAYMTRKFKGIVTEIANSANTTTTTSSDQVTNFTVKILILKESYTDLIDKRNPSNSPFRPGMSASVDIMTNKVYNVLTVPVQAVTTRIDTMNKATGNRQKPQDKSQSSQTTSNKIQEIVFLYSDGIAKARKVQTGIQDNTNIEITDGLKENEEVIVAPYKAVSKDLKDGDRVIKVDKKELFK